MATVNIGGDKADAAFRYKMPRMELKIEGRGNGIRTVILNMGEVAKALNVDPVFPVKYLGIELGAQSKIDSGKAILNGSHSLVTLSQKLDGFIKQFVLCPSCRLPEIRWEVRTSSVRMDCAACGHQSKMPDCHKLVSFILKSRKEKKVIEKQEAIIPLEQDEQEVEWSVDTSREAQLQRRQEELKESEVASTTEMTLSDLRLLELKGEPESQRYRTLVGRVFPDLTPSRLELLKMAAPTRQQRSVLFGEMERVLVSYSEKVLFLLHTLYENDLYDEEFLLCWHESPPESSLSLSRSQAVELRRLAAPFIEWLKTAEEED